MIQFNLLPDVKQQYIKTQRIKRLVITISLLSGTAALVLLLILVTSVFVVQKKNIKDLNKDIQTDSQTLKSTPHIADILTVQSQLNSLSTLNGQKPATSRLFGYLSQLTPEQATISDLKIDYTLNSVNVSGNAPSLDVVNTFIDGLKFTTYSIQGQSESKNAFSSVVLAGFSRDSKAATYSITFNFDPTIFDNADIATLSVGGQSQVSAQQPSIIFKKGE
jgi:Tfp pilus assembly protein PilN